jgi:hypothetical protein
VKETWLKQRAELQRLARQEGLPPQGRRGSLRAALIFAERLMSCPTEDAAKLLLHADRGNALSFLEVASMLDDAMERSLPGEPLEPAPGPFREFADYAVEFLTGAIELEEEGS